MAISTDSAKMTVELLMIRGFDSGQRTLYISTEAQEQHRRPKGRAAAAGRTLSDEVCTAVDQHLDGDDQDREAARVRRRAFAERMRARLGWVREETGEAYVERIRGADAARLNELERQWHGP